MKTNSCFRMRNFILTTTFSAGISLAPSASAFEYSALDIGYLLYGEEATAVLNAAGQVAGTALRYENGVPVPTPFITGPNGMGVAATLDESISIIINGINASGQVAGSSLPDPFNNPSISRAFITGPNGQGLTDLGTPAGTSSVAWNLNDSGQVIGEYTALNSFTSTPFITGPNGNGIRELVTPGDTSYAIDINAGGQVIGSYYSGTSDLIGHAFITGPNGMNVRELGTLGGGGSWPEAINDSGQVVGFSNTTGASGFTENVHAFITGANGMGMRDLGTLGENFSNAADINASGQVVGRYGSTGESMRPFVTDSNGTGMADLTSLVRLPAGVSLTDAVAINDRGQILAFGSNEHTYLLNPGDGSTVNSPLFPNSVEEGGWRFDSDTQMGQMVFVDPLIAVGYDYVVNSGPNFQSALFPSVEGDTDGYNILGFNAQTNTYDISLGHVNPGEVFSFSEGVSRFALRDIDITAGLDPDNPLAFPTGLTFVSEGTVSMMQSPIAVVPEPETYALLIAGLGLVGFMARRRAALSLR